MYNSTWNTFTDASRHSATCLGAFYRASGSTHIPEHTIIVESMKVLINLSGVASADPQHRSAQLYLVPRCRRGDDLRTYDYDLAGLASRSLRHHLN